MSARTTLSHRFLAEILPTRAQAAGALAVALVVTVLTQARTIALQFGIKESDLIALDEQFHLRFDVILRSGITTQAAVITFWAIIGLIAYLICWGAYNFLVEARNEVTLNTAYTNRGHWRGPYQTLGLKAIFAIGLIALVATLWIGLAFWTQITNTFIAAPSISNGLLAVAAIIGCAVQIYLVLAFAQLTFTPWYREEAFTEE